MILIFVTTNYIEQVQKAINSEYRLNELVNITAADYKDIEKPGQIITIDEKGVSIAPDWGNQMPPVLLDDNIIYSDEVLLGIVFCLLGNFEKSYSYLSNQPAILATIDLLNRIVNNVPVDNIFEDTTEINFTLLHNKAIAFHYGQWQQDKSIEEIEQVYNDALKANATNERKAFTVKHFATFLNDSNQLNKAVQLVEPFLSQPISNDAQIELKVVLCSAWMKQLTVPYNQQLLGKLKSNLWLCLQHYENNNRQTEAALLLIDASQVANISNSFAESLGYINKAINILQTEEQTELLASAQLRKGMLLYTWAQNGQPQFYRTALQALQNALLIFDRESAPDVFADIHHHLGVIYSEIQDEVKKKAVWAAVSVSSFTEALNFYNKVDYPYEFAMICHNFGNAYTKYPAALHSDNFDKALAWYREALDIRTAANYPLERCNTLYNYLEASWLVGNQGESFNEERFNEMWAVANELHLLSDNDTLKTEAKTHIEQLTNLKATFYNPVTTT